MPPTLEPDIATRIEAMRHEVHENGESVLSYEELRVLCYEADLPLNQWEAVAQLAISESWSFTFFPDHSVRFARL